MSWVVEMFLRVKVNNGMIARAILVEYFMLSILMSFCLVIFVVGKILYSFVFSCFDMSVESLLNCCFLFVVIWFIVIVANIFIV